VAAAGATPQAAPLDRRRPERKRPGADRAAPPRRLRWELAPRPEFAYDNELPQRLVEVAAFAIGAVAVTKPRLARVHRGRRLPARAVVVGGGLGNGASPRAAERPLRWLDGRTASATLAGTRALALERPVVHVCHHEGRGVRPRGAGCAWPSETEWELRRDYDSERGVKG